VFEFSARNFDGLNASKLFDIGFCITEDNAKKLSFPGTHKTHDTTTTGADTNKNFRAWLGAPIFCVY